LRQGATYFDETMTFEELSRTHQEIFIHRHVRKWPPAMVLVGAFLALLLVPVVGFGDHRMQAPDPETIALYAEYGMEAETPEPQLRWDADAFPNDKGKLMLAVAGVTFPIGLFWLFLRIRKRRRLLASEAELVTWVRQSPESIEKLVVLTTEYQSTAGRSMGSTQSIIGTRRDGAVTELYAPDAASALGFLQAHLPS